MRVLTGVDLNAPGHEWLVDRAARFAWRGRGRLDVLFVAKTGEPDARDDERLKTLMHRLPAEARGAIRREVGDPVETLIRAAAEYDAIVVGPREPNGLERMLKGTMAMRIIRGAPGAVLVPRGDPLYTGVPRMLVGLDLAGEPSRVNPKAELLFDAAARWTRELGGRLDVVHVDPAVIPDAGDPDARGRLRKEFEAARMPIQRRLEALLAKLETDNRGAARIEEGDPERALTELSAEYDVLVLGTLRKPGVLGPWRASVAENLVRTAKCDVLTVPTHR